MKKRSPDTDIEKSEKSSETLADLLATGPERSFELCEEDNTWLNAEPAGKERIE